MNILAIDQARKGAWAVFNYEKKELIACDAFEFPAEKYTYAQAVLEIEKLVWSVMQDYDISVVFIEDIQLRVNPQSFKRLAQLQGVLVNLFEKNEYLYDYIQPTKWQSFCGARGRNTSEIKAKVTEAKLSGKSASKILSIQFVKDKFGIDTTNDNLADAVCIGWYAVNEVELVIQQKKKAKKKRDTKKEEKGKT